MKNAIEIKKLTKDYKDIRAVDGLDLEIREGELFALLGVNGAGKTTTIKMLCCITSPTSGEATLEGKSIASQADEVKKIIAMSPQETAVAKNLSVRENLMLMCGVHGFDAATSRRKTAQMIESFNLRKVADKKSSKLSGGWQRRLSIAMALVSDPRILFLDEPTLGLDVIARSELWDIIRDLKKRMTIILTTHYMEEAEELSDRIGVMKDGHLLMVGTAAELKEKTGEDKFENAFIKIVKGGAV